MLDSLDLMYFLTDVCVGLVSTREADFADATRLEVKEDIFTVSNADEVEWDVGEQRRASIELFIGLDLYRGTSSR